MYSIKRHKKYAKYNRSIFKKQQKHELITFLFITMEHAHQYHLFHFAMTEMEMLEFGTGSTLLLTGPMVQKF